MTISSTIQEITATTRGQDERGRSSSCLTRRPSGGWARRPSGASAGAGSQPSGAGAYSGAGGAAPRGPSGSASTRSSGRHRRVAASAPCAPAPVWSMSCWSDGTDPGVHGSSSHDGDGVSQTFVVGGSSCDGQTKERSLGSQLWVVSSNGQPLVAG